MIYPSFDAFENPYVLRIGMRICVFSIVNYWHGVKGGMEIHGKNLTEGLVRKGHHVSIITTRHRDDGAFEEQAGVKVYYLKNTVFGSRRNNWSRASVMKFGQLHHEKQFNIMLSQSFAAYGLALLQERKMNIPLIPILQGCIRQEILSFKNNILPNYRKPLPIIRSFFGLLFSYFRQQRPLLSVSNRIITVSTELVDDLRRWYGADISRKSVTIPNGIDTIHFCPNQRYRSTIRKRYGIEDNALLLMTSGTLNREKGHHLAIDALAYIKLKTPNAKLIIVGTGEYRKGLEKRIAHAGLQNDVIFAGFVDNIDMVKYYNSADLYLVPTLRVEGLPFVLLEAMSCGKPVIASRIGGNTTVLKDGYNGLLIEPGNIAELAEKTQLIINDANLARSLSSSARKTISDHFSVDLMIDKTVDLMEETISEIPK